MTVFAARIALLLCLPALLAAVPQQAATRPGASYFPTGGLEIVPPDQWVWERPDGIATVARWVDAKAPENNNLAVQLSPVGDRTIDGIVKQRAASFEATVEQATLDGIPAFQLDNAREGYMALVAEREGYLYYAMLLRGPGADIKKDLEALRTSWKWRKIENPSDFLQLDPTPIQVMDVVTVFLPEHFRSVGRSKRGSELFDTVDRSVPKGRQEFQVDISLPADCQNVPVDQLAKRHGDELGKVLQAGTPIRFKPVGEKGAMISDLAPLSDQVFLQRSLIPLAATTVAQIDFFYTCDERFRKKYTALAEQIATSVRASKPNATPQP